MNLLVIEDESKTADALKQGLQENGYTVDIAHEGLTGLALAKSNTYQLIISDIVMPELNGIALCGQIRETQPYTPILLLTALTSKDDVVKGLNAGANDYLTKPFDFRELLARVRVLTRKADPGNSASILLAFSDLRINMVTREVSRGGIKIDLTAKEFKLLEYFVRRPNIVISRAQLAHDVWNIDFNTGTNMVEVYINYLRNKIDKPFEKKLIVNVHGVGYVLKEN